MATEEAAEKKQILVDLENGISHLYEPRKIAGKYRCNGIKFMRSIYKAFSGNSLKEDDFIEHMKSLGHYPSIKNNRYKFTLKKQFYKQYHENC